MYISESTIDFPKETLCPEIWEEVVDIKTGQNVWRMIPDIKIKIQNFITILLDTANLSYPDSVHITGSITSNQYTENADIDIHFIRFHENLDSETLQKQLTKSLKELRETNKDSTYIGTHPFEVYYQTNEFQDYMSVGCYDFIKDKWLVGPELSDPSFNPYSEYYAEIQKSAESKNQKVRDIILAIYEQAILCQKMLKDPESEIFIQSKSKLRELLIQADSIYQLLRNSRKRMSDPKSVEQALEFRNDRKWKIADATFKLLDKFGYLAILKHYIELKTLIDSMSDSDEENEIFDEITTSIILIVKEQLGNQEKLTDSESEQLDEGIVKTLALASLLAIPSIMPSTAVANIMKKLPKQELKMTNKKFQSALADINTMKLGNFSMTNAINILAWTLYGEAGNQYKRGKEAVASVILNRAGGVPEKMVETVFNPDQFSMWKPTDAFCIKNNLKTATSDKDYQFKIPKAAAEIKSEAISWKDSVDIATKLALGKFKSTIGNRNSYLNIELTKRKYPNSSALGPDGWATKMKNKIKIDDHTFGYLPENDGYMMNKILVGDPTATEYKVKSGDSLWKIAKMFNTSSRHLAKLNGITLKTPLKIGQIIKLKSTGISKPSINIKPQKSNIHIVKSGDTLWNIARKYKTTPKNIAAKNNININGILQIGQKLIV